ncbi:carnitine acetyl transferase [Dacryopinax primogenitus]|uniref:Carnitine acetyl transferase n=1 Tax=Dacryopinax primogenitus (strain DJM 731) TaxID=1858805 RepID=M5G692_DACPD|nr:carnitine acetyl transferase [Dacryopinax primogenitus]EJU03720.1 carnitine acetyl transferase [Dacryopinax primogenitus]
MPRPSNWKSLAPQLSFHPPEPPLPRLPVLPLEETITKLKRSLHPLRANEEQYITACKKLDEFSRPGGVGRMLQQRLEERERLGALGEDGGEAGGHWLERWWDDGAYMAYRDSIVVNVSYYYGFTPQPAHLPSHPAYCAASLTRGALLFRRALYAGKLAPDSVKEGPLCMDAYRWMFDCCRVPGVPADWAVSYAQDLAVQGKPGHVIVIRRNRFWKIEVGDVNEEILSTSDLERQFQHIYTHMTADGPAVGILGGNDRDTWSSDYERLSLSPSNASLLHALQSAAFVVCLDTERPESIIDFSRACWHAGTSGVSWGNRWYDKPLQWIVFDNGRAGFMGEHSVMDGTPTVRLCDAVVRGLQRPDFDNGSVSPTPLPNPEELEWHLTSADHSAILSATESFSTLIHSQAMSYHCTSYGKAEIKKFSVSPDSWAQMLIQLAHARVFPSPPVGTYEAATTRRFERGRTETIRTVSEETRLWVESMLDPAVGDEEKRKRFREACARHIALAREAGAARGVDRHMFGLKHLLRENEPMPEIYTDPLYQRGSTWVLSTSAIFSEHFPSYGWGEVVREGFGVAYMTGYDDRIQFTITSRKEMPNARFCEEIEKAAEEVKDLFEREKQDGKAKL